MLNKQIPLWFHIEHGWLLFIWIITNQKTNIAQAEHKKKSLVLRFETFTLEY